MEGKIETMWVMPNRYTWFIHIGAYTLSSHKMIDGYASEDAAIQAAKRAAKKFGVEITEVKRDEG